MALQELSLRQEFAAGRLNDGSRIIAHHFLGAISRQIQVLLQISGYARGKKVSASLGILAYRSIMLRVSQLVIGESRNEFLVVELGLLRQVSALTSILSKKPTIDFHRVANIGTEGASLLSRSGSSFSTVDGWQIIVTCMFFCRRSFV